MPNPASHSFMSQGLRLNYVDWGNTDAPLLLCLHGSRDHGRSWDWVADGLRDQWHVIAPDLRGHGDSAWSPEGRYELAGHVFDLAQLQAQLGQSVAILAHSLGAHIALRYAALFPERVARLILVEAVGAPPEIEAGRLALPVDERMRRWIAERSAAAGRTPRRYASVAEADQRMAAESPNLSAEQRQHLTHHGLARNEDASWSWKFDPLLRLWPYLDLLPAEIEALWQQVRCPTLLIHGEMGWKAQLNADLRRCLPHAERIDLPGAGHWAQHDRLDLLLPAVRDFLCAPEAIASRQ